MKSTYVEVLVPRYICGTRNHVLVKLTVWHDLNNDMYFIKTAFLPFAVTLLAQMPQLPDKCERFLWMSDILRQIVKESNALHNQQIGD